ncbi:MAG: tRNA 2-thiouridine(34) synthase MnmA [Chloroflexi bacterium]|nr:tRNA 2-thiouridine(34) synthase MnmA [Chloroflexota bacterium]
MSKGLVAVAMSGGVDSAVAAYLLKEAGFQVIGVTMRLWTLYRPDAPRLSRSCCSIEDVDDARRVCQIIGTPHYFMNFEREFREFVVDYFVQEYRRGRTPYPCLACNDKLKFSFLLEQAQVFQADYIATGHYAQRALGDDGAWRLLKGADPLKDQSYVLFQLTQRQLARILLPVGSYTKAETRRMARLAGLPVADKPDSQEICFVPDGNYRAFLEERLPRAPGPIVDLEGRVLGYHQGIYGFTIGQRHGLGLASREPLYVIDIDAEQSRVTVGPQAALLSTTLWASSVNWIAGPPPTTPVRVSARIRYRSTEAPGLVFPNGASAEVRFQEPQRAITPGQAVVFYQGPEVLGGGIIEGVGPPAGMVGEAMAAGSQTVQS